MQNKRLVCLASVLLALALLAAILAGCQKTMSLPFSLGWHRIPNLLVQHEAMVLGYLTVGDGVPTTAQAEGSETLYVEGLIEGDGGADFAGAVAIVEGALTDSTVLSADIKDGEIVNGDVSASAAVAYSKLAAMTAAYILVGNGTNVPTVVNPAGDIEIANDGTTSIEAGVIANADVNASAAISATKIADGSVTSAEFQYIGGLTSDAQTQIDSKEATVTEGSLTDSVILSADIKDDVIMNADINSSAAISATKIADGSVTSAEFQYIGGLTSDAQTQIDGKEATVTEGSLANSVIISADIKDGTIADADIASDADITYSKLDDIGIHKFASVAITYTTGAGGSETLLSMGAGTIYWVHAIFAKTTITWTVTAGDDEHLYVGDGLDTDGFLAITHTQLIATFTEATGYAAGYYGIESGSGGAYTLDDGGPFVYDNSGVETIDISWGATGDDLTAGAVTVYIEYMRVQ